MNQFWAPLDQELLKNLKNSHTVSMYVAERAITFPHSIHLEKSAGNPKIDNKPIFHMCMNNQKATF